MMNKAGKKMSGGMITLVIVGILIVGILGFMAFSNTQTALPSDKETAAKVGICPESTASVSFDSINALAKQTSVNATATVRQDNGPASASKASYPVGSNLEIFWSASNYIDKISTYKVACGGGVISTEMFATDSQTIRLFNTDGNPITSGGAVNQSAIASGGSALLDIKVDGKDKQNSGVLLVVLEDTNSSAVDTLTLSGLPGVKSASVPTFYTVSAAGAKAYAYTIDPIQGASTASGTLGINMKSGQTYHGLVKISMYSEQAFQDTDGSFKVGVENADGTTQYEDVTSFNAYVQ
jgi:hypothetical protein